MISQIERRKLENWTRSRFPFSRVCFLNAVKNSRDYFEVESRVRKASNFRASSSGAFEDVCFGRRLSRKRRVQPFPSLLSATFPPLAHLDEKLEKNYGQTKGRTAKHLRGPANSKIFRLMSVNLQMGPCSDRESKQKINQQVSILER